MDHVKHNRMGFTHADNVEYVALKDFEHSGQSFKKGDVVTGFTKTRLRTIYRTGGRIGRKDDPWTQAVLKGAVRVQENGRLSKVVLKEDVKDIETPKRQSNGRFKKKNSKGGSGK